MDKVLLGLSSHEGLAQDNTFLALYDSEMVAMLAIAAASQTTKAWVVALVEQVLHELGYGELKAAIAEQ